MPLIQNSYGKGRVRVMRVHRDGDYNEVRELNVQTMLDGDFSAAYTAGDNRTVVATDTIKNITYIVARENMTACAELFAEKLAERFLARYPQVDRVRVTTHETKWRRVSFGGVPHPHGFVLDGNGEPTVELTATREAVTVASGIAGYTFMKSTGSGWVDYVFDEYTTLPPTENRIAATAMDAVWTWLKAPADYPAANAKILDVMLEVFATTYSHGVQDSLFRMGEAALAAVPELATIKMACPNKHYLPMKLDPFGMSSDNMIFIATDEPHGQIECVVGR
jgi:urate oxidase